MFSFDFESWSDIFLEHYLVSVLISVIFVIATLIISMKYGQTKKTDEKMVCSENNNADENLIKSIPVIHLKKSPAFLAEKIIQEKMTDEQRNHEYEVQQKQLAQIFELMQKQSDKFGNISLSEVREQFKLYQ